MMTQNKKIIISRTILNASMHNFIYNLRSDKEGLTPEKLLVLQDHVLNYNVEVSLVEH